MQEFKNHPLYQRHNIDSAMNSVWDFYKKNFVVLFIISLVMSLVVQYISRNINTADLQGITDPMEMIAKMKVFIWPMLIITMINLLFTTIIHYYILHHSIDNQDSIFTSAIKSTALLLSFTANKLPSTHTFNPLYSARPVRLTTSLLRWGKVV